MTSLWVAGIGAAATLGSSYLNSQNQPETPQPGQLPYAQTPGSVNTPYGGGYMDPYTGAFNYTQNNFDPYAFGQQLDTNSMYDQFMTGGQGNSRAMSDMDYQIQQLQQQMQRLQGQNTGGAGGVGAQQSLSEALGPNVAKALTDSQGNLIDFSDRNALIQNPTLVAMFHEATKDQHGTFGKGDGFMNWFKAWRDNAGIDQKVQKYQNDQKTNVGNTDTRNVAIQDLQNKLNYLNQAKTRLGGNSLAGNPLIPFTKDIGGTWQGKGNNTNPNQEAWGDLLAKKMGMANADPNDELNRTLGTMGTAGGTATANADYQRQIDNLGQLKTNLAPGQLSELGGGALAQTLNFASDADFRNQGLLRDAQNARRGMLGGAVGELAHAQDSLNLGNQHNQNTLRAADYVNDVRQNQFGMDAQAFGANNAGIAGNNATKMGGLNFMFNAANTGFNQGLQRQDLANTMGNNWYNQALSALQQANGMRSENRAWDVQDYGMGRDENQALYGRNMDMFNLLNQQRQQTFGNTMAQNNANLQGVGQGMQYTSNLANQNTQRDLGQFQMGQAWQMGNAQNQAAQRNANQSAWGSALGGLASGIGSYYGGQQTQYNRTSPDSFAYDPNFKPPTANSDPGQIKWG